MSTPTNNTREIFARIEHGLAGCLEAAVMKSYIEHLVWRPSTVKGDTVFRCRHCGNLRGDNHAANCPAQQVA